MAEPVDAMGNVLPERLHEVFEGRAQLLQEATKLEAFARDIGVHARGSPPWIEDVDIEEIVRLLEQARSLLVDGAPHKECLCPAQERDCPNCGGRRWVSQQTSRLLSSADA